jgi:hypothetical protein
MTACVPTRPPFALKHLGHRKLDPVGVLDAVDDAVALAAVNDLAADKTEAVVGVNEVAELHAARARVAQ